MDVDESTIDTLTEDLDNKNNVAKSSETLEDYEPYKTEARCRFCLKSISKSNIWRHEYICSYNPQRTYSSIITHTPDPRKISSNPSDKGLCVYCKKHFKAKLNRHRTYCPKNPYKSNNDLKFVCCFCAAIYSRKDNLNAHLKKCNSEPKLTHHINCLYRDCQGHFARKTLLIEHLKEHHKSEIENPQELTFSSFSKFEQWKDEKEEETFSYFSKRSGTQRGKSYYYCQHDGNAKPHRKVSQLAPKSSKRKSTEHIKTGRICIAMIKLAMNDDGSCKVKYFPTHSHPLSMTDWKHHPQKKSVYKFIDQQIALNIPPAKILENIRDVNKFLRGEEKMTKSKLVTKDLIRKRARKIRRIQGDHDSYAQSARYEVEDVSNDEDITKVAVYIGIHDAQSEDVYESKMINISKDLHICGTCKKIFSDIQLFLNHKQKCNVIKSDEVNLPILNNTLSDNDCFPNETELDLPGLETKHFPLDMYYINEEVVGNEDSHQSQDELSPEDQLNEILTTSGIKEEEVTTELSEEVIIDNFSINETTNDETEEDGERPYECCYCDKAFSRQDKLTLHKRIHLGDKRFKCQVCEYATVDSGALRRHLRIHTDERPFKCQLCLYRARDASHLAVHLRTHTGDTPFFCQFTGCRRTFKTSTDLRRHVKDHKPGGFSSTDLPSDGGRGRRGRRGGRIKACERTQECPHCDAAFVRADSLRSHLRLHQISSLPAGEPTEQDEDIMVEETTANATTSHGEEIVEVVTICGEEAVEEDNSHSEEVVEEDNTPTPVFYISSADCPESLMNIVHEATIQYLEDNSLL
uniref:C2H2-type domain-containing protein n=1 Tax=Graphocephala atropunctata TaxID=36148 RepID=A0A1B6KFX1_9HEMI